MHTDLISAEMNAEELVCAKPRRCRNGGPCSRLPRPLSCLQALQPYFLSLPSMCGCQGDRRAAGESLWWLWVVCVFSLRPLLKANCGWS